MAVVSPVAPKLSVRLAAWDDQPEPELELDGVAVDGADLTMVRRMMIDSSKLVNVQVIGVVLDTFEASDSQIARLEGAALQAYRTNFLRVMVADCRLTGAEFAEGEFTDCVFRNVKLDEAGLRFAQFTRVRFENCMLRAADFSNARLNHVTFSGCDLAAANFGSAKCTNVDVSGEDLSQVKGILGFKGATISTEQLMLLAPLMANELGFRVV
jgi:uncharacterized protein YjbI with pentapeptide repeats